MNIFRLKWQKNKNIQPHPKKQHSYMKKECQYNQNGTSLSKRWSLLDVVFADINVSAVSRAFPQVVGLADFHFYTSWYIIARITTFTFTAFALLIRKGGDHCVDIVRTDLTNTLIKLFSSILFNNTY